MIRPVIVGSFTETYGAFPASGQGLTLLDFDDAAGTLVARETLGDVPNPSYVRPMPGGLLHVVSEMDDARAALAHVGVGAAGLALRGSVAVPGRVPCHVDPHPGGGFMACACYGDGHVLVYRMTDGAPAAITAQILHAGSSVHPVRQIGPHAHAVRFSPDGAWLLVADLGLDAILVYPFDQATGALGEPRRWVAPPGSGPRLIHFSADGRHLVVLTELSCRVLVLRWEDGALTAVQDLPAMIAPNDKPNTAAGLRWHPSMRAFGVSNRGADRIVVFRFDPADGAIAALTECDVGNTPRDFEFSPCGRWVLAGAQHGHTIAVLALDLAAGTLRDTGHAVPVRSPSCVRFLA